MRAEISERARSQEIAVVGTIAMPPQQFELLTRQIDGLSERVEGLISALSGDETRAGVYGRIRSLESWQAEHISTHNSIVLDRRAVTHDWRLFWMKVVEHVIAVLLGAAVVLLIFVVTGQVIRP